MPTATKERHRTPAQIQREDEAKSAWTEYLDERDALVQRSAELKALRLEADAREAKAAAKTAKAAKSAKPAAAKPAAKPKAAPKAKRPPR